MFNDYSSTLEDQDSATKARGHVFSDIQEWVRGKTGGKNENKPIVTK